jgi:site-specific DNA recombinase
MAEPRVVRCAIYTRKSSEEGLDQNYNSLAAQRDACAAYILSQKHEGWVKAKHAYDDGGFSGGNLERPGLKRLLEDVAAGLVDVIVIYKIDRLTRSLRDFAKLAEILDKHGASFVAVTQQFSTITSMGRLTLNVLLTFAQFEREVAGDRIRDKHVASKRLGMWMGGHPALGYDAVARKLVINLQEAEVVRHIYQRFIELRSMSALRKELAEHGIVSKRRSMKDGSLYGGVRFSWHPLHKILTNPLYSGMVRHKSTLYPGQHEAIVSQSLFAEVQRLVAELAVSERTRRITAYPSLLKGIIFDMAGERLYPTYSPRGSKKHHYYVSSALVKKKSNTEHRNRMRISAPSLERFVIAKLAEHLRNQGWMQSILPSLRGFAAASLKTQELATELEHQLVKNTGLVRELLTRIEMDRITIRLCINRHWLLERLAIRLPRNAPSPPSSPIEVTINGHHIRCGMPLKLVLENPVGPPEPDHRLIREILRAIRWFEALSSGAVPTILDLAKAEGCCPSLITDRIRLAFLAPNIVEIILEGRQPATLTTGRLIRVCPLPLSWKEQCILLL